MLKKIFILLVLSFCLLNLEVLAGEFFYPKLPTPEHINNKIDKQILEKPISEINTAKENFEIGLYYFLQVIMNMDKGDNKINAKSCARQAVPYFEKCNNLEPNNPYYVALLASAYGINVPFTNFPFIITLANKCLDTINHAVEIAPENPEIRLLRFRCIIHFPYQYFPALKDQINNDTAFVLDWINNYFTLLKEKKVKEEYEPFFKDIQNEVYYLNAEYYFLEIKDKKKAKEFSNKIDQDSPYYLKGRRLYRK